MRPFVLAVCWYVVPGVIWVLASDSVVALIVGDSTNLSQIAAMKGVAFVLVSGFIIYRLLARQRAAQQVVEAAYSESERGFQSLFKNNPLPVWAYDRETLRFLEINDVALAKYGYDRDELLAMQVTDLHPPEQLPELRQAIATPRQVREVSGIWRHRLKDGSVIDVEVQVHDLELHGRPARIVVALDVTERQRAFEAQQRRATRARALAEAAIAINVASTVPEALQVVTSAARTIIGADVATAVYLAGRTSDEGTRVTSVSEARPASSGCDPSCCYPELEQRVRAKNRALRLDRSELQALAGQASPDAEDAAVPRGWLAAPLVSRDGENLGVLRICDRSGDPADDGFTDEDEAVLIQLAQMTSVAAESARLFQEGLNRERRFRQLVEGLDAIVWEADPRTQQFSFVSPQAETMLGHSLTDWTSGADVLSQCMLAEDRERVRAFLAGVAAGRPSIPFEVRARSASGRSLWLRIEAAAHTDAADRVTHLRGMISDVTDERERDERTARGEKLRALGQLSSGVAHDLNQSLALIAGYGELLQQTLDDESVAIERVREMTEVMVRAASDGGETVRRMLTFMQTPKDEGDASVDLTNVIHEVVRLTAPRWRDASQAEGRPIELTVEIEGEVTISGSAASLREALTNLVLNAVDALPDGGTIALTVEAQGSRAIVKVIDNGIGMSDETRARVFEPFFTTKGDRGNGLGLPTVFGIVEAHGGELAVWSEPGNGTTFMLTFPLAGAVEERPVLPEAAPLPAETAQPAALRCLVVDDEPRLARMLSTMLRRLGHPALTAVSGEEALEVLAAEQIDLLLTDVGMGPSMNGWELAERALKLRPGLPVILATGWGASIDTDEARSQGIVAVLSKPYRQADLEQVLASVPGVPAPAGEAASPVRASQATVD
jgi:PAS domain S-box-containing protein